MKYQELKRKFNNVPVFSSSNLMSLSENHGTLKYQLNYWCKQGLVLKLRRGLYTLNPDDRKIGLSPLFIASQIRFPSYVSSQYALSIYSLIPEKTIGVTSVTTRKTVEYNNNFGTFIYQHIKPYCFNGFTEKKDENDLIYYLADPEKALLDFFYFNLSNIPSDDIQIFSESFRINRDVDIDINKLKNYLYIFGNKKLNQITDNFIKYWRE